MIEQHTQLGRLKAIHPIAPAYMQRAAGVAILAFIFFVLMLIGFFDPSELRIFFARDGVFDRRTFLRFSVG